MSSVDLARRARRALIPAAVVAVLAAAVARPAPASAGKPAKYHFLVWKVSLAKGVPDGVADQVEARLRKLIAKNPRLEGALPDDAPDPDANPKAFTRYIKRHKIVPFRVNVEVTRHDQEVEEAPRGGNRISSSIELHVFGEHMPIRSMAFTGEGSATVKLEIGKRIRARDREIADDEAIARAVEEALGQSLTKLDSKQAADKPRRKRRR